VVVLIVDEAACVRTRLRDLIAPGGIEVREACDGAEACAVLASSRVDVVLLDIHVRAETGLTLLGSIRDVAPQAVIVVLTNEASDVHRRECLRRGADRFLDKSRDFDEAVELVIRHRDAKVASRP
jgi:two-component system, chemotaxis family, chemotaxis protein CheY